MTQGTVAPEDRLFTPANVVTLVRICLVPVFILVLLSPWPDWLGLSFIDNSAKSLIATALFVLISCTDWIDGYLARSRNEVTNFGKFVDPLADKILVAAALLALVELGVLPSWPVLIILAREFIVSGVRMIAASRGEVIAASWYGKIKTVLQIIAIILFLVKEAAGEHDDLANPTPLYLLSWTVMVAALVMTIVSMLDYLSKARHLIGFAPSAKSAAAASPVMASSSEAGCDIAAPGDAEAIASPVPDELTLYATACEKAKAVMRAAKDHSMTLSTAESLTAGMISATLATVPGSSAVLSGGIVSYTYEVKSACLGVDGDLLEREGAVNKETACSMAEGARRVVESDVSVAVTGIAGPGGAEPGKPVGTVWLAVSSWRGTRAEVKQFDGNREQVRLQTTVCALDLLAEEIAEMGGDIR